MYSYPSSIMDNDVTQQNRSDSDKAIIKRGYLHRPERIQAEEPGGGGFCDVVLV